MLRVYKRLLMLGFISASIFFVGFMDEPVTASVTAAPAPCIEDCMASEDMCHASCSASCSTTDANCNSCIANCDSQFMSCMRFAVSCPNHDPLPSPACQVGFADHCPIDPTTGEVKCENAHSGFFEVCNTIGGNQCISCPDQEYCVGQSSLGGSGLPPCF